MSRSYRKPWVKDKSWCKAGKRFANRKVRNFKKTIANGSSFKRIFNSWNICDWKWFEPTNEKMKRK